MEFLIILAIAAATIPAMLFQTISNKAVQWILFGLFLSLAFGATIAISAIESDNEMLAFASTPHSNILLFGIGFLVVLNLIVVPFLYWFDKRHAKVNSTIRNKKQKISRVPETAFHALTAMGGAFGAFLSQQIFQHKRSKGTFQVVFFLTLLTSMAIYFGLWLILDPDLSRFDAWVNNSDLMKSLGISRP